VINYILENGIELIFYLKPIGNNNYFKKWYRDEIG
jgi:hypothetical protein